MGEDMMEESDEDQDTLKVAEKLSHYESLFDAL